MVINGLTAVAKTFSTDPAASATLLRQAIEPNHLKEHGYKELSWIARHVRAIELNDPALAVDIYRAAYGYAETSGDATSIGNSAILPLRSNRRQDYESVWFQLSEALPEILRDNTEAGVRAVVCGLDGYVRRKRHYEPHPGEPTTGSFLIGSTTANLKTDWSHSWYRGGFQPVRDGPVLLKKFDEFLDRAAGEDNSEAKIQQILEVLSREPSVVAAVWGSLLVAGARHPSVYARPLLALACAEPIMLSSDTRYQLGSFIAAAYAHLADVELKAVEHAILTLQGDQSRERSKAILAGCIPKALVVTAEMKAYIETLEQTGKSKPNVPPFQITSSVTKFDTDAYLASVGVAVDDPDSIALRDLMRAVEALSTPSGAPDLSMRSVKQQIVVLEALHKGLMRLRGKVPDKLFEHAAGELAEAAGRIARAKPPVLAEPSVKQPIKRVLLFSAVSENPHYDAEHEKGFQEKLSWGGPSARTAAAHGLLELTRASRKRDPQIMAAIRKLARDRVPEVRLQIIQNLAMLRNLDPVWAWSETEHVLAKEVTRGVVKHAIDTLGVLAPLDIARALRAAKGVIGRYRHKTKPGMATCRAAAQALIFDIHIHRTNAEADDFAAALMADVPSNAEFIQQLIPRYSGNLLTGSPQDPKASDNHPRHRTLAFYRLATERAFSEIEERSARLDIRSFNAWPVPDQEVVRGMFGILDEVSIRLHFAAGRHYDGPITGEDISPERARLYSEAKPILARLAGAIVVPIAHHLIQTLETFIPLDPPGVFTLIAQAVKSAEQGGYSDESMATELIVRIVERYLADYRAVFSERSRLDELMDCLDVFVRAGWPAAQALTFKLGEIWR
jgi:hypothetical protein